MSMARPSLREQILDAGVALLHERGYSASGVRDITTAAGVPLGSFTNHFRSKEAFAAQVLDRYVSSLLEIAERTLRDRSREPIDRLAGYFEAIETLSAPAAWRFGCLIANMGLEMAPQSDLLRTRLQAALMALTGLFDEVIHEAQQAGQARSDITSDDLALIVLAAWHGTLLRAKVDQHGGSPTMFARTLPLLLQAASASDR